MDIHENRPSRGLPRRRCALGAAAVLGLGLLTACGGNGVHSEPDANPSLTTPTGATDGPDAASSLSTSAGPGASTTTAGSSDDPGGGSGTTLASAETDGATKGAPSAVCGVSDLSVSEQPLEGGGTAGSVYVLLKFRNTSQRTCTLNGHPGVSFVGHGDGTQLGEPAARTGGTTTARLAPGRSTTALLKITRAGNYPAEQCAPTTADGLRIYPPDSRASTFVELRTQACQRPLGDRHQLTVTAVGQTH
jgi:hypothetical protein